MLERKGEVVYRLGLPPNLSGVHDVFHVSQLKKCLRLLEERVPWYGLDDTGRCDLHRASGEDSGDIRERVTWDKKIKTCKMQWSEHTKKTSR